MSDKPVKKIANLAAKRHWGLISHWLCYAALLLLFVWVNLSDDDGSITQWAFQTIPLLLPLYGMLKLQHKAFSWFCFITLFYFTISVVNAGMPKELSHFYYFIEVGLSLTLFFTAMLCSRWIQYYDYWQANNDLDTTLVND